MEESRDPSGVCCPRKSLPWNLWGPHCPNAVWTRGHGRGPRPGNWEGGPQACGQLHPFPPAHVVSPALSDQGRSVGTLGEILADKQEAEGKVGRGLLGTVSPALPPQEVRPLRFW